MPDQLIDTHIHIWDFDQVDYDWLKGDQSILNRSYAIDELNEERITVGVTEGVLVQAANNSADTIWMLKVASTTEWITGVVGWVPLIVPAETEKALLKYSADPYFKGVRHLIHNEADDAWLLQEEVVESLRMFVPLNLPYELVGINTKHIETALELSDKIPGLKMVFDHLNQPPISTKDKFGKWGNLMKAAAENQNLFAKISGLGTTANDPARVADDIKPYIEFVLEHFGTDRCFLGSDWPVSLLAGNYSYTWNNYLEIITALLNVDEQENIFYNNAKRFYQL